LLLFVLLIDYDVEYHQESLDEGNLSLQTLPFYYFTPNVLVKEHEKETVMIQKVQHGSIFPREDGKIIDEHFGVLNTGQDAFSLAHMFAPPAWREPAQVAAFDELVIVVQGTLAIEADGQHITVEPGETCLVQRETRVTYSNASQEQQCEYWSLCLPAFRPERTKVEHS
jgi:mannose-6-phosphate isomerase-like protein (cupin superfamily)